MKRPASGAARCNNDGDETLLVRCISRRCISHGAPVGPRTTRTRSRSALGKGAAGALSRAHCKPLEWKSKAADRRCDDSKALIGGVPGRITFYLKRDRVEAFDLRFDSKDAERLGAFLKKRYGPPAEERRAKLERQAPRRALQGANGRRARSAPC